MNDDSEKIINSTLIPFRGSSATQIARLTTADPRTAHSRAFVNRLRYAVAKACRTDIATVELPICNLLLAAAYSESDLVGDHGDRLDNSTFAMALEQARAIRERSNRDCTEVLKYAQRLPEPQRSIVTLRMEEGLKYYEIADRVDMDPGTVRAILSQHFGVMSDLYSVAPAH